MDGGAIRGLIPALVLAEIESRSGRPIAQLFDLVAGTSTGAIIACALTQPDPRRQHGPPLLAAVLLILLASTNRSARKR